MSRKSTIDALFGQKPALPLGAPNGEEKPGAVRTGAVAAMGASLQQWSAAQRSSEELQSQLAQARTLVEIDPASIDPAPVRDRLAIAVDPSFEALVVSIRDAGQQVPVLVRPHPAMPGRFQAAYGHRRIEASLRLGRMVKAIVAALDDTELVTAQGKENAERRDLTFIEKALFARRLEGAGHDRGLIGTALSIDKGDLSRAIAVAAAMPEAIIAAIGPAPKAGRARWLALSEALAETRARRRAEAAIVEPGFEALDSDSRFQTVLAAVLRVGDDMPAAKEAKAAEQALVTAKGRAVASWRPGGRKPVFSVDENAAPGFAAYLAAALPGLYQQFLGEGEGGGDESAASPAPRIRSL